MGVMQKKSTTARSWFLINIYYLCFSLPIKKKKKRWHSTHQTLWPLRPRVIARIMLIRNPFRSNQLPERGHCFEVEYFFFFTPRRCVFYSRACELFLSSLEEKTKRTRRARGRAKTPRPFFSTVPFTSCRKKGLSDGRNADEKKTPAHARQ